MSQPSSAPAGYVDDCPPIELQSPSPGCQVDTRQIFPLFFKLKRPWRRSLRSLQTLVQQRWPETELYCPRRGEVFVELSRAQLEAWLGKHARFHCVEAAGNRINSHSFRARIAPERHVPAGLRKQVRRIWLNDDPKFALLEGERSRSCADAVEKGPAR